MAINAIGRPFVGAVQQQNRTHRLAQQLYQKVHRLRETSPASAPSSSAVTLVCISDTHNTRPGNIPPGDILVHAGDLSRFGTFAEIQAQLSWLAQQPHPHKVVIAGNHDLLLDAAFVAAHPDRELDRHAGKRLADLDWGDIHYLQHSLLKVEVKGRTLRIFGSPWTPQCGSWAFQYPEECHKDSPMQWDGSIPPGLNVMLVHGPPKAHLDDGGKGCAKLLAELWRARPEVVVCGHIHAGRGQEWLPFDNVQVWYENVLLGRRQWWSLACLALHVAWWHVLSMLDRSPKSHPPGRGTHLVNAAVVGGRGDREQREAIVVHL